MTMVSTWLNDVAGRGRLALVLVATSLGVLLAQIDTSVVNLAVKSIGADLHSGVSAMQWVINSYNLVYASLLLTGGTLGDLYGRRRVFVLGIALFTVGTLICAAAPSTEILIVGRVVSGLGAAFEVPMSLVLLSAAFPDRRERAHAMGIWASCNGLAFIIGPTLGGWLVDSIGWRSIFFVILPICAAALALTFHAVAEFRRPERPPAGPARSGPRCLVPRSHSALYNELRRDELWDKFFTAAPQRLRRSVEQYKIVKRA